MRTRPKDILIVLNPRRIEECLAAINALSISKLWIRNHSELEIQEAWPEIERMLEGFENAFIISDDAIPRPHALAFLRRALGPERPVVTGYSNLSETDFRVNLTKTPVEERISADSYDLYTLKEIQEHPDSLVRTYFTGFSLTGMSLEMWKRYPYRVETDGARDMAADYNLSKRLNRDEVPIYAHREAFVWHTKEVWSQNDQEPRKRLLVGVEPKSMEIELCGLNIELQE